MENSVSVILPTYNERENVEELIRQVYYYTGKDLFEVIVVDDNSPDKTWEVVKDLQKRFKNLRLIIRKNESGLPSAVWKGIKESKGNVVVWLDCDLSHPPKLIPKLLKYIEDYDIVCASRYVKGGKDIRPLIRVITSKLINSSAKFILGLKIRDLTSGFYAVKKEVFSKIKLMETGFAEYLIRFSYDAAKNGFKFKEIGYVSVARENGISKTEKNFGKFLQDGYLCWKEIIKLRMGK